MGRAASAILLALAAAVLCTAVAFGRPAKSSCRVSVLVRAQHAQGEREVRAYHALRHAEFAQARRIAVTAPDYGPLSRRERAQIHDARLFREQFRLPHMTRYLRAVLRMS